MCVCVSINDKSADVCMYDHVYCFFILGDVDP